MTKVAIAYRSNDVFDFYVPRIQKILENLGHQVSIKVLERGTLYGHVEKELMAHMGQVEATGAIFLADGMFCSRDVSLDQLVGDCITGGRSWALDEVKLLFQKVLRLRVEKFGAPDQIIVNKRKITDHWPGISYQEALCDYTVADKVYDALRGWIQEVLPECKVSDTVWNKLPERTWLVGDRHEYTCGDDHVMRLPIENMAHDCAEEGLLVLEVTDEEIRKVLLARHSKLGAT